MEVIPSKVNPYLNTSHVKVQVIQIITSYCFLCNLNTSHVKVQGKSAISSLVMSAHLNTSHVKVQVIAFLI